MSRVVVRRKPTDAERLRVQRHQARVAAKKLGDRVPAAREVRVELSFDDHPRLSEANCRYTTFPPAQAHFVYACPLGDCDGAYDLNSAVFALLDARSSHASGLLHCTGYRAHQHSIGAPCGLQARYRVFACYATTNATLALAESE